jgi:hypothetical protein
MGRGAKPVVCVWWAACSMIHEPMEPGEGACVGGGSSGGGSGGRGRGRWESMVHFEQRSVGRSMHGPDQGSGRQAGLWLAHTFRRERAIVGSSLTGRRTRLLQWAVTSMDSRVVGATRCFRNQPQRQPLGPIIGPGQTQKKTPQTHHHLLHGRACSRQTTLLAHGSTCQSKQYPKRYPSGTQARSGARAAHRRPLAVFQPSVFQKSACGHTPHTPPTPPLHGTRLQRDPRAHDMGLCSIRHAHPWRLATVTLPTAPDHTGHSTPLKGDCSNQHHCTFTRHTPTLVHRQPCNPTCLRQLSEHTGRPAGAWERAMTADCA